MEEEVYLKVVVLALVVMGSLVKQDLEERDKPANSIKDNISQSVFTNHCYCSYYEQTTQNIT